MKSAKRVASPKTKPWSELTQEEKIARVNSLRGKYAGIIRSSEEFLKEKHEELDREEARFQERLHKRR